MKAIQDFLLHPSRETKSHLVHRIGFHAKNWRRKVRVFFESENRTMDYDGFRVHYRKGNEMMEMVREGKGIYEPELCAVLTERLKSAGKESPVFLDIGANHGIVTLAQLKAVPGLRVFAFEPGPYQAGQFAKTIESNELEGRVELNRFALSEEDGETEFRVHRTEVTGGDGLRDTGWAGPSEAIRVAVRRLDGWWEESGRPGIDAIKLDVEGAELFVLRGATKCLAACRPAICLEIAEKNLKSYPYSAEDIRRELEEAGYRMHRLSGEAVPAAEFSSVLAGEHNFLALPESE